MKMKEYIRFWFAILWITLFAFWLTQRSEAFSAKAPPTIPVVTPPVASLPSPSPIIGSGVNFECVSGYCTPNEKKLIGDAAAFVKTMVASQCLKNFIGSRALIQTNGRTPAQVAEHVQNLSGTVQVKMYYRCLGVIPCTSAVGFRQPPAILVNLNRAAFTEKTEIKKWVSVLMHEGLGHALGNYGHDFKWSPAREFSIPYSLNHAVDACWGKP